MPDHKKIPDSVKWQYTARLSAMLPDLYEAAFRTVAGEQFDAIEQGIWMEVALLAKEIIQDLSLPVENAGDLAESISTVMNIFYGPDFKAETIEFSKEGAVVIVRRCPLPDAQISGQALPAFHRCMALTLTMVNLLNKHYTARFVRTICTGDRQCELKIEEAETKKSPENE